MKASLVTQSLKHSLVCYLLNKFNLNIAFIFCIYKRISHVIFQIIFGHDNIM